MTTPNVTEITRAREPVARDTFVDGPAALALCPAAEPVRHLRLVSSSVGTSAKLSPVPSLVA